MQHDHESFGVEGMLRIGLIVTGTVLCLGVVGTAEAQLAIPKLPCLPVPKGAVPAQVLPNAAVPPGNTLWHQLGLPQSMERFRTYRDSRINRDGNSPNAERKPLLKPLSHEDFLKPEADPILKKAAEAKVANDLAPQKIKALKYMASLGCGCSKQDFEAAIIAGMEDCVVEVRAAAVQAVITSASGGCCGMETCPNRRAGLLHRAGKCDPCNTPATLYLTDCPSEGNCCSTCGSCCTYKIQEKLRELAFKMDEDGCYIEPNCEVRAMAEQALNLCPPREAPKEDEKRVDPGKPEGPSASGEAGDKEDPAKLLEGIRKLLEQPAKPESAPDAAPDAAPDSAPEAKATEGANIKNEELRSIGNPESSSAVALQVSSIQHDGVAPLRISDEVDAADDFLLDCEVVPQSESDRMVLSFSTDYTLPNEMRAMAFDGSGQQQLCQISESIPGRVVIRTTDGSPFSIAQSGTVQLGVLVE